MIQTACHKSVDGEWNKLFKEFGNPNKLTYCHVVCIIDLFSTDFCYFYFLNYIWPMFIYKNWYSCQYSKSSLYHCTHNETLPTASCFTLLTALHFLALIASTCPRLHPAHCFTLPTASPCQLLYPAHCFTLPTAFTMPIVLPYYFTLPTASPCPLLHPVHYFIMPTLLYPAHRFTLLTASPSPIQPALCVTISWIHSNIIYNLPYGYMYEKTV